MEVTLDQIREALVASWDEKTSYLMMLQENNPALGQCYPTARVVQFFFPETEIVEGEIWTGTSIEKHFWNLLVMGCEEKHIDLSWQQFPDGSVVKSWKVRERETLGDGLATIDRVKLLLSRVGNHLSSTKPEGTDPDSDSAATVRVDTGF